MNDNNELKGFEYLQKNEIKGMKCDESKPYAFISYSHYEYDAQIVMNVFKALYNKGFNLWIDTANMPINEDDWQDSAMDALRNKNCKFAFYFRSESSMIKETIAEELVTIKKLTHLDSIVTIDIWSDRNNNAEKFRDEILNNGKKKEYKACRTICSIVSVACKAIRLASDAENDISKLVDEMVDVLCDHGVLLENKIMVNMVDGNQINKQEIEKGKTITKPSNPTKEGYKFAGWYTDSAYTKLWDFANPVVEDITLYAKWEKDSSPSSGTIPLKIFLKNYSNQNFKKDTFEKFRLVGSGEADRFSTNFHESAFTLAWEFVMSLLTERGKAYIDEVNRIHSNVKNPVFITKVDYQNRDEQNRYSQITVAGLEDFYMYRHYSQYDWIGTVLKQRLVEFGLRIEDFEFEYSVEDKPVIIDILPETVERIGHISGRNNSYDAYYKTTDDDKYIVLKGSKIKYNKTWAPKVYEEYGDNITSEGILLCDVVINNRSTAAKFIQGTSTSGVELLNEKNFSTMNVDESRHTVNNKMGIGELFN